MCLYFQNDPSIMVEKVWQRETHLCVAWGACGRSCSHLERPWNRIQLECSGVYPPHRGQGSLRKSHFRVVVF